MALALAAGAGFLLWRRRGAETRGRTVARPVARPAAAKPAHPSTPSAPLTPGTLLARGSTAVSPATLADGDRETALITPPPAAGGAADRFGEFRLLEPLGRGGMASVFRVERRGEVCALKRPLAAFLEDPEFLERFLREAEIGRTLHHPNIIRIFDRGEVDGVPYFTMELVRGETLQARIDHHGRDLDRLR